MRNARVKNEVNRTYSDVAVLTILYSGRNCNSHTGFSTSCSHFANRQGKQPSLSRRGRGRPLQLPHLRITIHHLRWITVSENHNATMAEGQTGIIIGDNPNSTMPEVVVSHTTDFLLVHVQREGVAYYQHSNQIGLVQSLTNSPTGAEY